MGIVAGNIKKLLKSKGIKQYAFAKEVGYSQQQFSAMLNGRKFIKDTDLIRIATALSVDMNTLFENKEA